ncbi:MAG TPA: molybdenum cofactor guanylyltransferase [Bryobacteraceae bacterium]|nr:molybdenum cofactor guanylyltransferase [Bryobacteraceae bacterium]
MQRSGFVLAGGSSSRMGRDKALLAYRETSLVDYVARAVREAIGSVALIGDPGRYRDLGHAVYSDKVPGCGPLGGIYTALTVSPSGWSLPADWNLVVACDMPGISARVLRGLIDPEAEPGRNCVMAVGPGGEPEPLCAVYHQRCLPVLERAIREKRFKMRDLVPELDADLRLLEATALVNVNTAADWAEFQKENAR